MSTSYARAGYRIAGRFDLAHPYAYQPDFDNATAWIARDVALSRQVRAVVINPDDDQGGIVADAARRAALVSDPHLVAIVQVVADDDHAYITEIPPGRPLADYLTGEPLPADQVHAIVGGATSAIATGARHGVRHLHTKAETIFLTPEGDVLVDGLGVYAALGGADTSKEVFHLDRDEARGLTVLLASLLLGRNFPEPWDHDAVIAQAANLDLPDQLATTLASERDGDGAASPADLTRRLVPWGDIRIDALPEPRGPEPIEFADTVQVDAAGPSSDDTLIFVDDDVDPHATQTFDETLLEDTAVEGTAIGGTDIGGTSTGPDALADAGAASTLATGASVAGASVAGAAAGAAALSSSDGSATSDDRATSDGPATSDDPAISTISDEAPRASTHDEVNALIDEELGIDSRDDIRNSVVWPGLSTVTAPVPLPPERETDPAGPTDPAEPTDPAGPTDPTEPTDPTGVEAESADFAGTNMHSDATNETVEITPIGLSEASSEAASEATDATVAPERLSLAERFEETAGAAAATAVALAGGPAPGTPAPTARIPLDKDGNPIQAPALGDRLEDAAGAAAATAAALAGGPAPGTPAPTARIPLDKDGNPIEPLTLGKRFEDAAGAAAATATALAGGPVPGAPAPRAKIHIPKMDPERAASLEQARREKADARASALEGYGEERGRKFDASRIVLVLFGVAVLILGWLGFRTLTAPFDPVTLTNPDSNVSTAATEDPAAAENEPDPTGGSEPEPTPAADPTISTATLVSPDAGMIQGIDPTQQDSPRTVGNAVDGNPATAWESWTYVSATMNPMSGIGLHVELTEEAVITEVLLDVASNGGNIQIRDTVPDAPSSGKVLAEGPVTQGQTTMTLSEPLTASSFIIWITELPQNASGGNQIVLNEITLN